MPCSSRQGQPRLGPVLVVVLRASGAVFFGLGFRGQEPGVGLGLPLFHLGLVFLERLARRLRLGAGPLPADL